MSQYLPPMAGGGHTVVPGPVREGHCPPCREIVVIETRKVFDFCFQEDNLERCFFLSDLGQGATVTGCEITQVTCREVADREPLQDQEGLALVSIRINLTLSLTVIPATGSSPVTITRHIAFPKRVVLCAPLGTDVTCDVRGTCICTVQESAAEFTNEPNVCCTIQLCTVVKSTADINILVPSYGTVVPKECRVSPAFGGCPPLPPDVCGPFTGNNNSNLTP